MSRFVDDLKVVVAELKRQREELALQVHLGSAEVWEEWDELEKQWDHFSFKAEKVFQALKDSSDDIEQDLSLLAEDLRQHYQRIRQQLK